MPFARFFGYLIGQVLAWATGAAALSRLGLGLGLHLRLHLHLHGDHALTGRSLAIDRARQPDSASGLRPIQYSCIYSKLFGGYWTIDLFDCFLGCWDSFDAYRHSKRKRLTTKRSTPVCRNLLPARLCFGHHAAAADVKNQLAVMPAKPMALTQVVDQLSVVHAAG
jgi:hypothetical protein